jgi:hypothetical protein
MRGSLILERGERRGPGQSVRNNNTVWYLVLVTSSSGLCF